MHLDLRKTAVSILGYLVAWKIIFYIFSPGETSIIILVSIILVCLYGIQIVEWPEKEKTTIFGVMVNSHEKIYSQYTLFGILPISNKKIIQHEKAYFKEVDISKIGRLIDVAKSALPFGGILSIGKR